MDGAGVMAGRSGGEDPRVEELLRVNAELAAELRSLAAGRAPASRRGRVPAARGIAHLRGERDALETRLEETQAALAEAQTALEEVQAHREGLERQNQEMATEIVRLRAGLRGLMRRARARALARTGLFAAR
jgi:chromosome segregation ATPase